MERRPSLSASPFDNVLPIPNRLINGGKNSTIRARNCRPKASSFKIRNQMEQYPRQYLYLRTVRAKLFIDANFASDIDLDKIADEACFSKFHFVRLFKS